MEGFDGRFDGRFDGMIDGRFDGRFDGMSDSSPSAFAVDVLRGVGKKKRWRGTEAMQLAMQSAAGTKRWSLTASMASNDQPRCDK